MVIAATPFSSTVPDIGLAVTEFKFTLFAPAVRDRAFPVPQAGISPRVVFDSEASGAATLIKIVTEDRPGLLYDLATAISANGGNIEVVLIDTQAHRAIDVFYVTADGGKLSAEKHVGSTAHRGGPLTKPSTCSMSPPTAAN